MLVAICSNEFRAHQSEIFEKESPLVFNLSSYYMGVPKLELLFPSITDVNYANERDFDLQYYNYIMNIPSVFYEFFNNIVYPLYCGKDVYLLVDRLPLYDALTESLFKIIQERYGYNCCYLINEYSDLEYMNTDALFSVVGIYNLDIDKDKYSRMFTSLHLNDILRDNAKGGSYDD